MDQNTDFVLEQRIERTMKNLEKNNMRAYKVENEAEALKKLEELIPAGGSIGIGGSMTLFETGAIDFIRKGDYVVLDRYAPGLTPEDIKDLYRKALPPMCT